MRPTGGEYGTGGNNGTERKLVRNANTFRLFRLFRLFRISFGLPRSSPLVGICFALCPDATVEDFEILRRIRQCLVNVWLPRWWRSWRKSFENPMKTLFYLLLGLAAATLSLFGFIAGAYVGRLPSGDELEARILELAAIYVGLPSLVASLVLGAFAALVKQKYC